MKTGFALSGGGSKGIFQAVVCQELIRNGIIPDALSGVSAGALNAALISTGQVDTLVHIWRNLKKEDIFQGSWNCGFLGKCARGYHILRGHKNSIYDNGTSSIIREYYDPNDTKIPSIFGAVSLKTENYIKKEVNPGSYSQEEVQKIQKYLVASSSIPFIFPPIKSSLNDFLVDGGLRNITPLADLIHKGVDKIYVITNNKMKFGGEENKVRNLLDVLRFTINILKNEILKGDIQQANRINQISQSSEYRQVDIEVIHPPDTLGSGLWARWI